MVDRVTAQSFLKTENIITCSAEDHLSHALSLLQSSHDAVFVTKDKELLGLINPYYTLYQSKFPATTKVENCLFSPPRLTLDTPLPEIAHQMIESKVYFLPVFDDNGNWEGIVTIRRILRFLAANTAYANSIDLNHSNNTIHTIQDTATVGETHALLKQSGVSRLPVVNESGTLQGLVTRYDLRDAFIDPKHSPSYLSRSGEKEKTSEISVKGFIKPHVITGSIKDSLSSLLTKMLDNNIGSIVIVDRNRKPMKIVSSRDILEALAQMRLNDEAEIIVSLPDEFEAETELGKILQRFYEKYSKRNKVKRLDFHLKESQNTARKVDQYEVSVVTHHPKVGQFTSKSSNHDWKAATRSSLEKIESQIQKNLN